MNPTCGPLPCPMTTSQPPSIIEAMCAQVSLAAMYWSRTFWCITSLISELPPIATSASFLATVPTSAHRQGHHGFLGVKAVLCFVVHRGLGAVNDLVGNLNPAVGRQRVHEDGAFVGHGHAS